MKAPKAKPPKKEKTETEPSSWDRFKDAIHRIAPPKKAKSKQAGKIAKSRID
jgi:hypothetical protein